MQKYSLEKFKIMATLSLINKYFWKTKIGPIFSTVSPFLFMIIHYALTSSVGDSNDLTYFVNGLPTYLSMSIIPLAIITLPSMNIEFKNSILLRKIKTSGIQKIQYNIICIFYFFMLSMAFSLLTLIFFLMFSAKNIEYVKHIDVGTLIYGILILSLTSISLGMFASVFMKAPLSSQLIGFAIFILTLTFSGQFIPVEVISKVEAIKYMSLFSPLNYGANILNIACLKAADGFTNSIFDFNKGFSFYGFGGTDNIINLYDVWQKAVFAFVPIALIVIFEILSIKFFKWTGR